MITQVQQEPRGPKSTFLREQCTATHLSKAGFDKSVIEKMQTNEMGMLRTLWTMLLSTKSHSLATHTEGTQGQPSWLGSIQSWLGGSLVEQEESLEDMIHTCSTCSSATEDDFDPSSESSPATSVAEEDEDNNDENEKQDLHRMMMMVREKKKQIKKSHHNNNKLLMIYSLPYYLVQDTI